MPDPVVPLDPDRLDAIEAQPSLCNECRRPLNTTPGCIGHYPQPMRVLTEADALALVAAAREAIALRADAARLAAFHEEQHRSLTSHAAELTVERDALRAKVERLTAEIRRMRND